MQQKKGADVEIAGYHAFGTGITMELLVPWFSQPKKQ